MPQQRDLGGPEVEAIHGEHRLTLGPGLDHSLGVGARSARWPAHAPEQARWVRARIDDGLTFAEILAALERGEFKRPVST